MAKRRVVVSGFLKSEIWDPLRRYIRMVEGEAHQLGLNIYAGTSGGSSIRKHAVVSTEISGGRPLSNVGSARDEYQETCVERVFERGYA